MSKTQNISDVFKNYKERFLYWPEYEITYSTEGPETIVVIPAYHEDQLLTTLESLDQNKIGNKKVIVLVVLNYPVKLGEKWAEFHHVQYEILNKSKKFYKSFELQVIQAFDLPEKRTGVGAARKIGMDQALKIFADSGSDGIIMCLDGDCTVSQDYLRTCTAYFADHKCNTLVVPFEHPTNNLDLLLREGILAYELHLRYYKNALKWTGFPYAYHTVGSSMGVRASVYGKLGGMNRRRAGEDFYFLNKCFAYGGVIEMSGATVYPSARVSDRVPFGTGRAQEEWMKNKRYKNTYHFDCWRDLKLVFMGIDTLNQQYELQNVPEYVLSFFQEINFVERIHQIQSGSNNPGSFIKNFYHWFDGFLVMKFLNYLRDSVHGEMDVVEAAEELAKQIDLPIEDGIGLELCLDTYRELDKR